jgi:uncharacterized protein (TIGR04222 family)
MTLINNPIANMYGPYFLLFYAVVIIITLIICKRSVRKINPVDLPRSFKIPDKPDPYEITYLRGGKIELVRLIIYELIQEKFLEVKDKKMMEQKPGHPDISKLPKIKQMVFNWFSKPASANEILLSKDKFFSIGAYTDIYERTLKHNKFITTTQDRIDARRIGFNAAIFLFAVAFYKISVALLTGHSNIWFLVFMYIAACILIYRTCKLSYLSSQGETYLEKLRTAFSDLKSDSMIDDAGDLIPEAALAMGIYGFNVLGSTAYAEDHHLFARTSQDVDFSGGYTSSGFSTASGSCSGGSSCSSGDSGGSSCSGGGGCGGCGGGGGD